MLKFALKNMAIKKAKIILIVISIVISATVALLAYNISEQVDDGFKSTTGYYNMIIGPSGSQTQLAMNSLFFTETPLGTISSEYYEELAADTDRIFTAIPFTMGDSYNSAKIVGTSSAFLDGKKLEEGRLFSDGDGDLCDAEKFTAVVGYEVAQKYNLKIGSKLITSHGMSEGGSSHEGSPLTVVGILEKTKTAYDNVVFTSVATVWATHDHGAEGDTHADEVESGEQTGEHEHEHGEICAVLLQVNMRYYFDVQSEYSENSGLSVINPQQVIREVMENVDMSSKIVYVLCVIILIMNIFIISVITLLNMYDSKKEISLMRLIGIGMNKINLLYIIQNAIIGVVSTLLAFGASRLCLALVQEYVASMGIVLDISKIHPFEGVIMAVVFVVSILPTVICTLSMSRKDGISD